MGMPSRPALCAMVCCLISAVGLQGCYVIDVEAAQDQSTASTNGVTVDKALDLGPTILPVDAVLAGEASVRFSAAIKFNFTSDTCQLSASMDTGTVYLKYKREDFPAIDQEAALRLVPAAISVEDSKTVILTIDVGVKFFGRVTGRIIFKKKEGQHRCCFKEWDAYVQLEAAFVGVRIGTTDEYRMTDFALDREGMAEKICPAQLSAVNAQSSTLWAMMFLSTVVIATLL